MRRPAIWALATGIAMAPLTVGAQTFIDACCRSGSYLSADGTTLASAAGSRWTEDDGWHPLPFADERTSITGLSSDGSVVVGCRQFSTFHWKAGAEVTWFDLDAELSDPSLLVSWCPAGVSADGSAMVGLNWRWTEQEGVVPLVLSDEGIALPADVSGDASVVVGSVLSGGSSDGPSEAFRWTADGGLLGLGFLDQHDRSGAFRISTDGSVVVGTSWNSGQPMRREAFRWTNETGLVRLGLLEGWDGSGASASSADGSVVVGALFIEGGANGEPFIWDRTNGMQVLADLLRGVGVDLSGWDLWRADGISDDAHVIAGTGWNPDGTVTSWIATLDCPNDDDCDTVLDADDNCPGLRTDNIDDANGNGIGDMCECGDQTGDGHADMNDIMAIVDVIFEREEASVLCDTNDDDRCDVSDILGVNAKIFGAPAHCARYPAP